MDRMLIRGVETLLTGSNGWRSGGSGFFGKRPVGWGAYAEISEVDLQNYPA